MAVTNDIVLGVTRAADPAKLRAAAARLESLSAGVANQVATLDPAEITAWTTEIQRAAAQDTAAANSASPEVAQDFSGRTGSIDTTGTKKNAYIQFEAVLLQNMIQAMMPEDDAAVYGSGTAGSVWKSMMAEKIATEIARTGRLGIAKQIAAGEDAVHAAAAPVLPKANSA